MKFSYHLYHKEKSYLFAKTLENRNTKWGCTEQQLVMDDFQKYSRLSTVATACPKYSQVPNASIKTDFKHDFLYPIGQGFASDLLQNFEESKICCFEYLQ